MEENDKLIVCKFENDETVQWDDFVLNEAINGNFLHTRRFLSYHPIGKFIDASYMVYDKKMHLVAVCPACVKMEGNNKVYYSHLGSTYGGILVNRKWYKLEKVISIIKSLEEEWIKENYQKVILKQSPNLLSEEKIDLIRYCFFFLGFHCCEQINLFVDLEKYSENILSEFAQGKRTNIHNCQKKGLYCKKLSTFEEIEKMHHLLEKSLEKYNVKPVHSSNEIWEFQEKRLFGECECFGVYDNGNMLSASMMFYFKKYGVAHAQYLCADPVYNKLSPMTYMYYEMLVEMRKRRYQKVSWGICTENNGSYLNIGLARSKENLGSKYDINPVFIKNMNRIAEV